MTETNMEEDNKKDGSMQKGSDYEVGYRKPPVGTRFAHGVSGNPKGRPRGRKSLRVSLQTILDQKITTRVGDKVRSMSKVEAILSMMVNAALKGDFNTGLKALALAGRLEADATRGIQRQKSKVADMTAEEIEHLIKTIPFEIIVAAMTDEQLTDSENALQQIIRESSSQDT